MIRDAKRALVAVVMGAVIAAPAMAQAPAPAPQKAPDPNEVICEKQEVIGSRLQSRRICRTRAQWADVRLQDRQEVEKAQVPLGIKAQ